MKSRRAFLSYEKNSSGGLVGSTGSIPDRAFLSSQEANISGLQTGMIVPDKGSNDSSPSDNPYGNPYDLSARFNPSMAIIIVVLLSAFFFMGFFSIYVRRCTSEEDAGGNSRRGGGGGNRRMSAGSQGLEKTLIESFPLFSYSLVKGLKQGKGSLECAVCLSEFEEDETLRLLPKCGHAFHPDCIDMWLFSHTTCPLCRCSLVPESATVEGGTMATVEGQPPLDPSQATEQVVIVLGRGNLEQDRIHREIDHQGRGLSELNAIDAGLSLSVSDGAPIHYNQHSSSVTGSPILGVVNALRPLETRSQSFRRSHSTGHSLVSLRGNPEHPSELYISTDNRYAVDFSEGLLGSSSKPALHRSSSCATFTYYYGSQEFSRSEGLFDVTERLWRFPSSTEPSGFEVPYAHFYHEQGSIKQNAADQEQELARLSEIHLDPRIKSDRWNISVHSPFFFRTLSESRALLFQQQLPSISPSASNESFPRDRKDYLQYVKKSLLWLTGRDRGMASNNCPGPSRHEEQGGLPVFVATVH